MAKRDHIEKYETDEIVKVDPKPESTTATTTVSKTIDRFDQEVKTNGTSIPGKCICLHYFHIFCNKAEIRNPALRFCIKTSVKSSETRIHCE